ncbi:MULTISPECIES: helix-turn-helix domain-containing protein [Prauserella salsuginis group]|uniref:Helix-turn-helix domain-containing protein n=1 Tax=Prauserella salsuginis TaxID=387889 RepID=A0ABW6G667_9PSEU|nr:MULTISPECIES: helix-turn-helix domain-containing protein [Prauserella salsuginis group]
MTVGRRADGAVHRGLPSGHLTLNISLGEPVRIVGMPRGDQAPGEFRALLGGLHTAPVLIARNGTEYGMELALEPSGAAAILGVPAAELAGHVVDLADLGGDDFAVLPERLAEAPGWPSRFAILDDVLSARVNEDANGPATDVAWAWRRIRSSGGTVRVEALAREAGWSRRHFGERFRREIGLTPKQAARVVRFERAVGLLKAGGGLAETAARCGFSDQPHLTAEWRALAGCAPTAWLADELPFLQDPLTAPVPDSEP